MAIISTHPSAVERRAVTFALAQIGKPYVFDAAKRRMTRAGAARSVESLHAALSRLNGAARQSILSTRERLAF